MLADDAAYRWSDLARWLLQWNATQYRTTVGQAESLIETEDR